MYTKIRNAITHFFYIYGIKQICFRIDPEIIHERMVRLGAMLGKCKLIRMTMTGFFGYKNKALEQRISNITFKNPIGLAAGFDYEAKLIDIFPSVGFGAHTVGTITNEAYEGNTGPRLARLPKSKSFLVNKGFKSSGMRAGLKQIQKATPTIPLGISIGATNKKYDTFQKQIADLVKGFKQAIASKQGTYYELNISCPNLSHTGKSADVFSTPEGFRELLTALAGLRFHKPVFVKMYLDKTTKETKALMDVAADFTYIKGFVFSNLCKDRTNPLFDKTEIQQAGKGHFSGKPTFERSNKLIAFAYKNYADRFIIIGCGGVFSAEDAYEKIKSGASLVQLITGMIYEGPQVMSEINRGLVTLLKKDGYNNISEAIGTGIKK
jgi:dihydroorotate dehydrogenase